MKRNMKKIWIGLLGLVIFIFVVILGIIWYLHRFQFTTSLVFDREYSLETHSSRFDYQVFGEDGILYINHMGDDSVIALDTKTNLILQEITGIGSPRGVAVSFKYNRAYVTSPDSNEMFVIDTDTNSISSKVKVGASPDGLAVDDTDNKVFVTNESGKSVSVVDQISLHEVNTIPLASSVGNTKYDSINGLVYTAVHNGTFVIIDPVKEVVTQSFDLADCSTPHGFTFDSKYRQALITCQGNSIGIIIDLVTGKELYRGTVGTGADVVAISNEKHVAIVSSAAGIASLFQFGDTPTKIGDQFIALNAHTVAIDEVTNTAYFPVEQSPNPIMKVYTF